MSAYDLMPREVRAQFPELYSQEEVEDPTVHLKWFLPGTGWTWYVIEWDHDDLCFGLVQGHETELGYFTISELLSVLGPMGLHVERDLHFTPKLLSEVRKELDTGSTPTSAEVKTPCLHLHWQRVGDDGFLCLDCGYAESPSDPEQQLWL